MNDGMRALNSKLEEGKTLANSEQERGRARESPATGTDVGQGIRPASDRQAQGRGLGNATVRNCRFFICKKMQAHAVKNSTEALDVADVENRKLVEARRKSDETAGTATIFVALFSTLLAVGLAS